MRLRRQLLLVSLLTLALPWAGCEYIREMEKTLRQGQQAALTATAQAVAARLSSDPETHMLITGTGKPATPIKTEPVYAHSLNSRPIVDGYDDDWRELGLVEQNFASPQDHDFHLRLLAGKYGDELFLFCRVQDNSPRYYSPLRALDASDHVRLWLRPPAQAAAGFSVYTGAPGKVAVMRDGPGNDGTGQREHSISGVWQEWQGGYQLELRLPLSWTQAQLGFNLVNASSSGNEILGNFSAGTPAPRLVSRDPTLDAALHVFTDSRFPTDNTDAAEGTLLRLASPRAGLIAEAGELIQQPVYRLQGNKLLTRLYRLALGRLNFPLLDNPRASGSFTSAEVLDALAGRPAAQWYQSQGQQVVRVAVPIGTADAPIGAVVAEQTTDTLHAMTDSAFSRLVSYSLAAFGVTGLGLITYASWLSWRIRRLSKAAENAVDDNGRISQSFPQSHSRDEIGDLSRRYGDLLERLGQYNSYLETLASKLSHELRTPLAVVRSSLDNLEQEQLSSQASIYTDRAKDGAERLSHILTAMSAASRVEQSISTAELEPVDLRTLLRELIAAYADIYPKVNWRFSAECERATLLAAPELLVQMLDKLADNAADFCPEGQSVQVELQQQAQDLVIRVSNPGPPLPEQLQGQLFNSLVSARDNQTGGHHLGLGLHIVRLIADFHGGTVAASNLPGASGAAFVIRLPIR